MGQVAVPCVLMRGGTSRGPIFHADDLPTDPAARDRLLLRVLGSPDLRQIDGIGGATTVTSKVAVVSPSEHEWAQVDYLFAQVSLDQPIVDTAPSCGNMLSTVGPYAIEQGLVPVDGDVTTVRIRNLNTGALIESVVQTPGGEVTYEGNQVLAGVPGTGSPIVLRLRNIVGSKTGALLPSGNRRDIIGGMPVSCVDVAMPMVFVPAEAMGVTGYETRETLNANRDLLDHLEKVRTEAALLMGFGDVSDSVVPKIALVAPPVDGGNLASRYFTPLTAHPSFAVLGAICTATAAVLDGTVVHDVARTDAGAPAGSMLTIEHPAGTLEVGAELIVDGPEADVRATIVRTARRLFSGSVHVPRSVLDAVDSVNRSVA